jgi:hypothetical protein
LRLALHLHQALLVDDVDLIVLKQVNLLLVHRALITLLFVLRCG